jgi:hypothetical protein
MDERLNAWRKNGFLDGKRVMVVRDGVNGCQLAMDNGI